MKLKVITSTIIGLLIIVLSTIAFAATGTVEINSNEFEVKKGETFKVILSAASEDGINGIDAKYNYDSEELELISENLVDSANWSSIGTSNNITIISNSLESIKNADLYELEFKVKDNAKESTEKIEFTQILLDTDAQTDSEVNIESKNIEVIVDGNNNTNNSIATVQKDPTSLGASTSSILSNIGKKTIGIFIILILLVFSIIFWIFYNKVNKEQK